MKRRLKSLAVTLAYENEDVVEKFQQGYAVTRRQADELFLEMKRWLWLLARADQRDVLSHLSLDERLLALDEMWHTFILFTPEYHAFCDRYLGGYVHHQPSRVREYRAAQRRARTAPARFEHEQQSAAHRMISLIETELGPDTVRKWYFSIPRRYSVERLNAYRRSPTP